MKILGKKVLVNTEKTRIVQIDVEAPDIAKKAKQGQFVVVMANNKGERIPLTVVDAKGGAVTLVFQEAGLSTKLLGKLNTGDSLYAIVGPLGRPTEIKNYGKVILVGGGVGIAEAYPVAKAFKEAGNKTSVIIGARTKALLILEDELKKVSDELYIATDDGSYGRKGVVTDILKEFLEQDKICPLSAPRPARGPSQGNPEWSRRAIRCTLVYAVGPIPMMRKTAEVAKEFAVKTVVSLNSLMLDGTGMCGGCRAIVGGESKFACVDGPEFDASLVDWDVLEKRNRTYADKEKHICKLYGTP